jgi:hypothetical protein
MEQYTYIYVLQCKDNTFYIGKTDNPKMRMEDHFDNRGSEWTKIHEPLSISEIIKGDPFDEDKYVKMYMSKYGINNVRGGSYSNINLTQMQIDSLTAEIYGAYDRCFRCGGDHFVQQCTSQKSVQTLVEEKSMLDDFCDVFASLL